MEYLAAAYAGRCEMLGAIFGTSDDKKDPAKAARTETFHSLTAGAFDGMFPPGNDNE